MTAQGKEQLAEAFARLKSGANYGSYVAASNLLRSLTSADTELKPLKVAIARNLTIEPLLPVLEVELARAGFHPALHVGDYDAISNDLLAPNSSVYEFAPDFILIAQWLETLAPRFATRFLSLSSHEVDGEISRILSDLRSYLSALRSRTAAPVLVSNFVPPPYPTLGILDSQSAQYQRGSLNRLNEALRDCAREFRDIYIVDLAAICARIGYLQAVDYRYWHIGRAPLSRQASIELAREYVKFVRALRGRVHKVLVLDCDNTLWGGVVGEDGPEGIRIGSSYPGSCFVAFQNEILNLKDRGVLLALCSKNNEADVREVLHHHPEMILREKDFAAWQINWDDKVTNLRRIASQLNLGLDSLVFVDDNRFECDLVRQQLPEVEVLHLGPEPSTYVRQLSEPGYFDSLAFSEEDQVRTQQYQADAERQQLQSSSLSLSDYLAGLQLVATIGPADDLTIPRIAQLTQKTNQFNLTTRRYTEGAIQSFVADRNVDVFYMRLRDRASDLGLIAVAILKYELKAAHIDTFLMSCRALGRRAEDFLLSHCLQEARRRGCESVEGQYLPTAKNAQVKEFFGRAGFTQLSDGPEGSRWQFRFDRNKFDPPKFIQLELVQAKDTYAHK